MAYPAQQGGYPQGPQGFPPAGPTWQPPARRQGGSKALPIAIGAGLAVGVFVGLLVIRGTGGEASAEAGMDETAIDAGTLATTTADAGLIAATKTIDAGAASAAMDASPKISAAATATLSFEIENEESLEEIEVLINDEEIEGRSHVVTLAAPKARRKTKVRVKVRAKGHQSYSRRITVEGDQTLAITLRKRRGGGVNTKPGPRPGPGPGGIIDL